MFSMTRENIGVLGNIFGLKHLNIGQILLHKRRCFSVSLVVTRVRLRADVNNAHRK